jgi:hypothetical protein
MKTILVKTVFVPLIVLLCLAVTVLLWSLRKLVIWGARLMDVRHTPGQTWIDSIWLQWTVLEKEYVKFRSDSRR